MTPEGRRGGPRTRAEALHREAIVIDLVCPLARVERHLDEWIRGGVTAIGPTVAVDDGCAAAMREVAAWYERLRRLRGKLLHVTRVEHIRQVRRRRRLGIIFHFQNTMPFERDPDLVELYYRLGVRVAQLTYNTRNWVGDGCEEPADSGLSAFGRRIVREMNRVGMVVDLSHTGHRTTMDAMEVSSAPCIFSHANAFAVHGNGRNIRNDQIKALAASGGVIGLNGFPAFVGKRRWPTVDDRSVPAGSTSQSTSARVEGGTPRTRARGLRGLARNWSEHRMTGWLCSWTGPSPVTLGPRARSASNRRASVRRAKLGARSTSAAELQSARRP